MTRKSSRRGKASIPESQPVTRQARSWKGKSLPGESILELLAGGDILPMCLQGADGSVLGVNHAWLRLAGCEADLRLPRSYADGKWRQTSCTVPDGRRVHMLTARAALPEGMQVVLAVDVTQFKGGREHLRRNQQLADELYRTGYTLTIEHLMSWLIHEISQPLMATVATAQSMRRLLGQRRPDLREIGQSLEEVMGYQRRVARILQRLRAGLPEKEPKRTRLDVSELILEVVRFLTDHGDLRGTRVQLSLARNPPSVSGARVQLRQALLNLILGAVEAMRTTPAQQRRLWISATSEGEPATMHIVVRDSGVRPRKAESIQFFGALARAHSDATALGLAVAEAIVVEHRGRLWVERARRGAELHLVLPAAPDRPA